MHASAPSVSLLLPTRNRPDVLQRTLARIAALPLAPMSRGGDGDGGCELVIVDNASEPAIDAPRTLRNGIEVTTVRLCDNRGAAGRNSGACAARGEWLLMLDDDSYPLDDAFFAVAANAPADVAAIGLNIRLPHGEREHGGLPEVIIGCGALVRRDAFLDAGGYDPAFQYYVEEYDLCARLIAAGWRIVHDMRASVRHEKVTAGRDMNHILHRLVRNNGWTLARYAPDAVRDRALAGTIERYRQIAAKEHAMAGFLAGLKELEDTMSAQPRSPLSTPQYDRLTGLAAARATLHHHAELASPVRVAIVRPGKHMWAVREALREMDTVELVASEDEADVLVIGTLSPGPMLDAADDWRDCGKTVLMPWRPAGCGAEIAEPSSPRRAPVRLPSTA